MKPLFRRDYLLCYGLGMRTARCRLAYCCVKLSACQQNGARDGVNEICPPLRQVAFDDFVLSYWML